MKKRLVLSKIEGFTIIELLLYMGIFSILLLVIFNLFLNALDLKAISESFSSVQEDGRFIVTKFENDITNANSITSPAIGSSSNTMQFVLYGTSYTYRLNNNNVEFIAPDGTYILNGHNSQVKSLSFQNIGNVSGKQTIQLKITLQSLVAHNNVYDTISLQTTAGTR